MQGIARMMDQKKSKDLGEFEWQALMLGFEFHGIDEEDAVEVIRSVWRMWRDPKTRLELQKQGVLGAAPYLRLVESDHP